MIDSSPLQLPAMAVPVAVRISGTLPPLPRSPDANRIGESRVRRALAAELQVSPRSVDAAVDLLDGGATVPFIARYRKEATDGLDDTNAERFRGWRHY